MGLEYALAGFRSWWVPVCTKNNVKIQENTRVAVSSLNTLKTQ